MDRIKMSVTPSLRQPPTAALASSSIENAAENIVLQFAPEPIIIGDDAQNVVKIKFANSPIELLVDRDRLCQDDGFFRRCFQINECQVRSQWPLISCP
jgi:hypothetical protein